MPELNAVIDMAINLWKEGNLTEAAKLLDTVLLQQPNDPLALYLLGSIALNGNSPSTALVLLEKSVKVNPKADWAWHNLGIAYKQSQDVANAERCYKRALRINPKREETVAMMAGCYVNAGQPKKAIQWADRALKLNPDCPHAKNHKALALLELSQWEEGWNIWRERWDVPERARMKRDYKCPMWDGGPVDGTLVVHGEQGLGDEILFMTCFDEALQAAGPKARVVVEASKRLVPLFRRSFDVPVYATQDEVMKMETPTAWISMGDLPAMYRRSEKDFERQPYSVLDPDISRVEYWRERVGPGAIGIAWYGGVAKTHSKLRNAPVDMWREFVESLPGRKFVSVQYETGDTIMEAEKIGVPHFKEAAADVDDLTALIESCEHIITVCQTAHHQAGGLGKSCWTLVPSRPAWRYHMEGSKNLWYPSVRQFRQQGEDWAGVFEEIRGAMVRPKLQVV